MSGLIDHLLNASPIWVYLVVGLILFAEDAIFVGFVLPGETAAVVGGVAANLGHTNVVGMCAVVVAAAIVGDTVGYEVGKHFGTRLLAHRFFAKRHHQLDKARDFLARKGGSAVFLGRFVAFFRAVMPALAGTSKMPYRRFITWNALGGIVWGIGFVLLGFLAGASYRTVAKQAGYGTAIAVAAIVVTAVLIWRVRKHGREAAEDAA